LGHRLVTTILSNLNRFKKITERFLGKFVVKWILKIPPHLAYVATLPCEVSKELSSGVCGPIFGRHCRKLMRNPYSGSEIC